MTTENTLQITVSPQAERCLSPYRQRLAGIGYDAVNDEFCGKDGISFKTLLDAVNPLQQLPGISTAYRETSDATIAPASRLIGGALLGGPVGFAVALFNEIVKDGTGQDIGSHIFAAISDNYKKADDLG